jgi:putative NADH-flavin reductase
MTEIVVLGITGRVGSRIGAELLRRGHRVIGLARTVQSVPNRQGLTVKAVDAADKDALVATLRGNEVLISAMRFAGGITATDLIAAAKRAGLKRLLVVGGAGSLHTATGKLLLETPDFPPAYKTEALAGDRFLATLRAERELDWTFLSPSAEFAPGSRTGRFRIGADDLLIDAQGHSHVSMEDFAIAMVDEVETPRHDRSRFTVGY